MLEIFAYKELNFERQIDLDLIMEPGSYLIIP